MKRVIGIGNALTDMLVNLKTDSVLGRFKLAKGSMSLVDTQLQTEISKSVAGLPYSLSLGGSAGNTIRAMAQLGCKVGFIGKVGHDTTGDFFVQALENLGIEPIVFRGQERSGKCVSLISADGERTMVTHLGAALELSAEEIEPTIFDGYDCLYIEGYLVQSHELILKAARTAKECGLEVAIDLASFNIVAENLTFLRELVREYVDIVFANEDEAKTFTCEAEPLNARQTKRATASRRTASRSASSSSNLRTITPPAARDFPPAGQQTKGRPRRISPRWGLSRSSEQMTDNGPFFEKIEKITTFERFCFKLERVCPKSNASAF